MRRLACHLFTLCSLLSLLLCVAVVGLWVRSYLAADGFEFAHHGVRPECGTVPEVTT